MDPPDHVLLAEAVLDQHAQILWKETAPAPAEGDQQLIQLFAIDANALGDLIDRELLFAWIASSRPSRQFASFAVNARLAH
jgi:hypothetical protein